MPNHIHLILEALHTSAVSRFMQGLSLSYAKHFSRRRGASGHVWQDRFQSRTIEDEEYYFQCAKYVELNPVKAHLVFRPEEYPWSSYRFHAFRKRLSLLDRHVSLGGLEVFYRF